MTTKAALAQNFRFKMGWTILLILTALMTVNHIALPFYSPSDSTPAIGFAAFNLYALVVIWIPFRRYERWAWYTTWILPAGLALPAILESNPGIVIFYSTVSAVLVLGLLLTLRDFFPKQD
jgi:hypothetical protein